jgi:5'-3' exonuclease
MVAKMIEEGATHIGVATDHVIESFRNSLWPGYKTGAGIDPALYAQFQPLEEALASMGVVVWPMVEFEADDALASAAHLAERDKRVQTQCICTPDKDLPQCEVGQHEVQFERRSGQIRDEHGVRAKFGVAPEFIPDYLALVGDAADGYPGLPGIGPKTAATLINRHGHIEQFPVAVVGKNLERALLFKDLATLRIDAPLCSMNPLPLTRSTALRLSEPASLRQSATSPLHDINDLHWKGPTASFVSVAKQIGDPSLATRVSDLQNRK